MGIEQSRRDDLEGLGYTLIYLMNGNLPWQGVKGNDKKEKHDKILQRKMSVSINKICQGLPTDLVTYMYYCRSLTFEDKPDYTSLKKQFKDYFTAKGFNLNFSPDWMKQEKKHPKEMQRAASFMNKSGDKGKKEKEEKKALSGISKNLLDRIENIPVAAKSGENLDTAPKDEEVKKTYTLAVPQMEALLRSSSQMNESNIAENDPDEDDVKGLDANGSCNFNVDDIGENMSKSLH